MKKLIIIGASAMGRETYDYARDCKIEVKGFLDSRKTILDNYEGYPRIIGPVDEYTPCAEDVFICAIGDPVQKRRYCEEIAAKGGQFISIVHPYV